MSERLHKVLARHGLGSRRQVESWMHEGRVLVNGRPAAPGTAFERGDRVTIDGRDVTARLKVEHAPRVLIYNKPAGETTADRSDAEPSVYARLPAPRGTRWIAVNRMSPGDSGLLVLTSDGRLANALMRRAATLPAAYSVRVLTAAADFDAALLAREVELDDATIVFDAIEPAGGEGTNRWFTVVAPGADRRAAVRALFESQGLSVSRVIQLRFAGVELPRDLPRGRHREAPPDVTAALYAAAGLEAPERRKKERRKEEGGKRKGRR